MDLGDFYPCLNVADLAISIEFYRRLGFELIGDYRDHNWAIVRHRNCVLCLFQGHIERNLMNFRGGDIEDIVREGEAQGLRFAKTAHVEEDGSWSAEVFDPDGNCIYLNTSPDERAEYLRNGRLISE